MCFKNTFQELYMRVVGLLFFRRYIYIFFLFTIYIDHQSMHSYIKSDTSTSVQLTNIFWGAKKVKSSRTRGIFTTTSLTLFSLHIMLVIK